MYYKYTSSHRVLFHLLKAYALEFTIFVVIKNWMVSKTDTAVYVILLSTSYK